LLRHVKPSMFLTRSLLWIINNNTIRYRHFPNIIYKRLSKNALANAKNRRIFNFLNRKLCDRGLNGGEDLEETAHEKYRGYLVVASTVTNTAVGCSHLGPLSNRAIIKSHWIMSAADKWIGANFSNRVLPADISHHPGSLLFLQII